MSRAINGFYPLWRKDNDIPWLFQFFTIFCENLGKNIGAELRRRIAELENQLETTGHKLADKRDKLKLADRQLTEFQDEFDSLSEKRDDAQRDYSELTEKKQVQICMRLTDAVFGRLIVDIR